MPPDLLHLVGYLTGATLYAMLLVMAVRDRAGDRLMLGTACLGLAWNAGEVLTVAARAMDWAAAASWLSAAAFSALGFLAAVVVDSVARGDAREAHRDGLRQVLARAAYGVAGAAAVLHAWAAAAGAPVPATAALVLVTAGLLGLAPLLLLVSRRQANAARAIWMTALAVFAVSALHLGNFHGEQESWVAEIVGHHASIPLAFAILYQDYRFALADLFLKQALTLLAVVAVVFGAWSAVSPQLADGVRAPGTLAWLLGLWVATVLLFPVIRGAVGRFVDRVILQRGNYTALGDEIAPIVQQADGPEEVLARVCEVLARALGAESVRWTPFDLAATPSLAADQVVIQTTESPGYVLTVGRLAGGRRLLSADTALLERVAALVARRIDALRLTDERYERMLREREIRTLATEAELTALRAQINPHFLFNTLTTIGYLIQTSPARALDTLMRFTALLRGSLKPGAEFTTLGAECALLEAYLAIERERFEERLEIDLDVPATLKPLEIPALIVQPLVENAIKHGVAGARAGGRVSISARLEDDALRIAVRNTGAPFRGRHPSPAGGVGLSNVERRLANHYGDAARLTLAAAPDGATVAEVTLPVDEAPALRAEAPAARRRG